jgi:phage recombination protein Bet
MMDEKKVAISGQGQGSAATITENQKAVMEVVRKTLFPGSSDAELYVYMRRCQTCGVDPLDGLITPICYGKGEDRKLSFITTIDLLRSRADSTGLYDGQDEPEFDGETVLSYKKTVWEDGRKTEVEDEVTVPDLCRVKVYKKDVSRPFIGVARWKEYYPGDKKGGMWQKMPFGMLAKCAEALAIRKAFPKETNKLYAAEEMEQVIATMPAMDLGKPKSDIGAPVQKNNSDPKNLGTGSPDEGIRKTNKWISEAAERRIYALCSKHGVNPEAIKAWLSHIRKVPSHLYSISWSKPNKDAKSEYERICETIEKTPEFYAKWNPALTPGKAPESQEAPAPATTSPEVSTGGAPSPREAFEIQLDELADASGISDEEYLAKLNTMGYETVKDIPEEKFAEVLKFFPEA